MAWNHRIMRHEQKAPDGTTSVTYGIVEAYYNKKGDKRPHSWTEGYCAPIGETVSELTNCFAWMMAAMRHPILNEKGEDCEKAVMLADDIQEWINAESEKTGDNLN